MKVLQVLAAVILIVITYSIQADPPDPTPGATKPVREQNLDANDWIAVHEQGTAKVEVQGTADVNVTGGSIDANITGGSVEAEITGGEIDVNVKSLPPCEAPARYQLVGSSTERANGSKGILTFSRICQRDFGLDARMCNSVEVMETVIIPDGPLVDAWVRPVFVGDGSTDASGVSTTYDDRSNLSCFGWSFTAGTDATSTGLVVTLWDGGGNLGGRFWMQPCPIDRPIACCAPVQ